MSAQDLDLKVLISSRIDPRRLKVLHSAGALADEKGWKAYLVGGAVRDLLLGAKNFDLDLLIERHGLEFARELAARSRGAVKIYRRFATAMVVLRGGIKLDITTTRKEEYPHPGALPRVLPGDLKEDLFRRDFTINAMAVSINRDEWGKLIDPNGGWEDLKRGIIRVLHPRSFQDDPTRVFRAVRFQRRLKFKIEPRTEELIRNAVNVRMFDRVSPERLRHELELILEEPAPEEAIDAMARYDQLRFIHPRLNIGSRRRAILVRLGKVWSRHVGVSAGKKIKKWRLYLAALVWPLSPAAIAETGRKFSFPERFLQAVIALKKKEQAIFSFLGLEQPPLPSLVLRRLRVFPAEALLLAVAVAPTEVCRKRIEDYLVDYSKIKLEIGGQDLIRVGLKSGPEMGEVLDRVLFARLDGKIGGRSEQLALARKLVDRRKDKD